WATRVGIDTVSLPVRLPATAVYPELLLVLSADQITLTALDAQTGYVYWQHRLSAPCLGPPVIVGRRAYVGTYDGRVHEIETIRGHLLGYFELGQPLTVGGVWQEGTDYLYFPGDSDHVYVLDIAATRSADRLPREKGCVGRLQTGHPSGSLRSPPMLINRVDPYAKDLNDSAAHSGYLVLNQTDGLDDMKLQVFPLPIEQPDPSPILQPELR